MILRRGMGVSLTDLAGQAAAAQISAGVPRTTTARTTTPTAPPASVAPPPGVFVGRPPSASIPGTMMPSTGLRVASVVPVQSSVAHQVAINIPPPALAPVAPIVDSATSYTAPPMGPGSAGGGGGGGGGGIIGGGDDATASQIQQQQAADQFAAAAAAAEQEATRKRYLLWGGLAAGGLLAAVLIFRR